MKVIVMKCIAQNFMSPLINRNENEMKIFPIDKEI